MNFYPLDYLTKKLRNYFIIYYFILFFLKDYYFILYHKINMSVYSCLTLHELHKSYHHDAWHWIAYLFFLRTIMLIVIPQIWTRVPAFGSFYSHFYCIFYPHLICILPFILFIFLKFSFIRIVTFILLLLFVF